MNCPKLQMHFNVHAISVLACRKRRCGLDGELNNAWAEQVGVRNLRCLYIILQHGPCSCLYGPLSTVASYFNN